MRLAIVLLLFLSPQEGGKGAIAGIIRFKGDKPERKSVPEVAADAFCKECHKEKPPLRETWVFGKNGADDTLQNVFVYVSKGLEGVKFDPPSAPAVLDQVRCIYTPHVLGVMVGQKLEIRNSDDILHNVMCAPMANARFNEGMPGIGRIEKVFQLPEFKVRLSCAKHPWMLAYVHVLEHPFFAVTGADGAFTIKGLPPGEYEISVLHESARFEAEPAKATVKVGAGQTKTADFTYRPKSE